MGASASAIEIRGLKKTYANGLTAVDGIDLVVQPGEVFALLGPNGAGKTTTVEILEGYRTRTSGDVKVLGVDPGAGGPDWKARIGIVLQTTGAFEDLTVEEVVSHFAVFYPKPLSADEVIKAVGLEEKRHERGHALSGGQKRRLDIALGLVGDPELIFLDEPTTGLDPVARRQTWTLVQDLAKRGKTVLLTTHYLDEAEALADRAGVIAKGKLLEVAHPKELGGRASAGAIVRFRTDKDPPGKFERDGAHVRIATDTPTATVKELADWSQGELAELTVTRPSLEDIYLKMIGETP
jgi:ABC-2 type transport system ATP-binding protein